MLLRGREGGIPRLDDPQTPGFGGVGAGASRLLSQKGKFAPWVPRAVSEPSRSCALWSWFQLTVLGKEGAAGA